MNRHARPPNRGGRAARLARAFAISGATPRRRSSPCSRPTPVALACEAEYRAEMPTLCLQPGRRVPRPGRDYRLADGQALTLTGRGPDGTEMSISLGREVAITAARTHVSVEMSIPRALIDKYGLKEAKIDIGETVAAVPVAAADDLRPQTSGEIGRATGEARRLAAAIVYGSGPMPGGAADDRMSNGLAGPGTPMRGGIEVARRSATRVGTPPSAFARFNYDLCKFKTGTDRRHGQAMPAR